jgi:glycosyltransferase involved in cell wall biosynthesis
VRILAVNWRDINDPMAGGAEQHLHHILAGAVRRGWQVDLCCADYPGGGPRGQVDGVEIHRRGHWTVANLTVPTLVRELLRRNRYDLIVEDINKIPFYTPLYAGKVPVLAVVPHLFGTTVYRETNALVATYVYAAESLIPRVYGRCEFEVISPSTRDDLIARGLDAARVTTIFCGLEHERFTLADPPSRDDTPLLVSWSRLRRYKSLDVAIRAFDLVQQQMPDARLLIMGRGPDEKRLRALVARLGMQDKVEFRGFQPWDELVRTLHRCHVFLNPSPKEGWGLTVIEANQCGLPVVATDAPGLRDSVRDGETGVLVPYGDPQAMAEHALLLLRDREYLERMATGARAWAATFDWNRCIDESLELMKRTAAQGTRPTRKDPR